MTSSLFGSMLIIIAILTILSISIVSGVITHSRKIREQEAKFRLLFNKVSDALIVFDIDEKIHSVNESAGSLLKYQDKEIVKSNLKDIIVKDKWLELSENLKKVFTTGKSFNSESSLLDAKGNTIEVEVIGVKIKLKNKQYILTSFRDITRRKHDEMQLRKKHIALQEVLAHLEDEKLKIKQQVAKTVDQVLMPTLNRINSSQTSSNQGYFDVLKNGLEELSSTSSTIVQIYSKLTPREIEICNLIKNGSTSKEIAQTLNISMLTVNKHRERIRKKLVISNKSINLTSYLKRL